MQRRIAGICKHHDIDFDLVRENLVFSSGEDQKLVLAEMKDRTGQGRTPAVGDFIQELKRRGIMHVVLDPFVSLHKGVPENDNSADGQGGLHHPADCATRPMSASTLIHHTVKDHGGDSEKRAGDQNAAPRWWRHQRRRPLYLHTQPDEQNDRQGVRHPARAGRGYIRLDDGRRQITQRYEGAPVWFGMRSVNIRDDPSDLTALVSATGEPLEDKEVPRAPAADGRRSRAVGSAIGPPGCGGPPQIKLRSSAAQAEQAKLDKQYELLQLVAEAMPSDRCHVAAVLDAVKRQRGVEDTTARSLVKKAVRRGG